MAEKHVIKPKDGELPIDVKTDKCGMVAQNLATTIEKIDALIEEKGKLCDDLYKALVKSKRTTIQVSGMVFERIHRSQNKIVIKKAK